MSTKRRRLGRPPASSSAKTRGRILDEARRCFADLGYESTTNKVLAERANITTGAIYHYFESKLDMYVEVHNDVQQRVYDRLRASVADCTTFRESLAAVLDTVLELHIEDPSLARFLVSARGDSPRSEDLLAAIRPHAGTRQAFFGNLVDIGVATGEIREADREMVLDVITAMAMGLVAAGATDGDAHRRAIAGFKRLFGGDLVAPAPIRPDRKQQGVP